VISAPSVPCSAKTSRPSPSPKSEGSESTHRLIRKKLVGPDPSYAATLTYNNPVASSSFTVPAGITRIQITARGADGGLASNTTANPGAGATIVGVYNVTPGDVIRYVVGAAGAGGDFEAGGGGEDNTGAGGVGQATTAGGAGFGSGASPGGTAGTGGFGGGGGNNGGIAAPVGDGGAGGGGINGPGLNVASFGLR
jgi:hypothetical protein